MGRLSVRCSRRLLSACCHGYDGPARGGRHDGKEIGGASFTLQSPAACCSSRCDRVDWPAMTREPSTDWAALMAAAQGGDSKAYGELLRSITPYLRTVARRAGLEEHEIEDGVQDILLTVHAIRQSYDPRRPFAPWLLAVARHRLMDGLRRRGRLRLRETALTADHETFAADETNRHEEASEVQRLRKAIAGLPPGQRQAVELLRLQELSLKEAAARSGQSPSAL